MLKFSKKIEYALISMLYMAEQEADRLTTAKELSQHFNIPQEVAGKVMQKLAKYGCINSVQGVKGGYQLANHPAEIRLTNVINAVDGPVKLVNCVESDQNCGCDQFNFCNMRNPMELLQTRLVDFFDNITLGDLQTQQILANGGKGTSNVAFNFDAN